MTNKHRNGPRTKAGEQKNLYWFRVSSVASVIMILAGTIVYIIYSHRYGLPSKLAFMFHVGMLFLAVCLFTIAYDIRYQPVHTKGWRKFAGKILGLGLGVLYFVALSFCKDSYDAFQIRNHGQKAVGIITEYESEGGKGGTRHYATFQYIFQGEQFTQRTPHEGHTYAIGDSLELTVSGNDPEIVEVTSVKR